MNLRNGPHTRKQLCFIFVITEEDEGNPAAIGEGSHTDTDEGTIMNSQELGFAFLKLIIKFINYKSGNDVFLDIKTKFS